MLSGSRIANPSGMGVQISGVRSSSGNPRDMGKEQIHFSGTCPEWFEEQVRNP